MNAIRELRGRIERLLDETRAREADRAAERQREMERVEEGLARFDEVGGRWMGEVVLPRLEALASMFPNARLARSSPGGHRATVAFDHCDEYPAGARLDVELMPELASGIARLRVRPSIIPILMAYEGEATAELSIEAPDAGALERFLEDRIVQFVSDYVRVRDPSSYYQRDRTVTDPVCGMSMRRAETVASCEHEGRTHYFCSERCRARFAADPGRFAPGGAM